MRDEQRDTESAEREQEGARVEQEAAQGSRPDATTGALRAIEVALRKTRRLYLAPRLLYVALWALIALGAVMLCAMSLAVLFPQQMSHAVVWVMLGGAAAVLAVAGGVAAMWLWRGPDELEVARLIQQHVPEFRHDLVSALRFGRALEEGSFDVGAASPELARLHVARVARRVEERATQGHLGQYLPRQDFKPVLWALGGVALMVAVPLLVAPSWWQARLDGSVTQMIAAAKRELVVKRPVLGNLMLVMRPPEYTGYPEEVEPFTTGNVRVIAGTYIDFQGYVLPADAMRVELVIRQDAPLAAQDGKEGEAPELEVRQVEVSSEGRATGGFLARAPLSYWFRAVMRDGSIVEEGSERRVEVTPDELPKAAILSHQGTLEVSPDEVLDLEVSAQDDFGLTEVARLTLFVGSEQEKRVVLDLPALQSATREWSGHVTLDLAPFDLQPRDQLMLQFEAVDNNTASGPGTGRSQPLMIQVSSPDDKHMRNVASQQEIVEALLGVLADYLEAPLGARKVDARGEWRQVIEESLSGTDRSKRYDDIKKVHARAGEVLEQMKQVVEALEQDPLMVERDLNLFVSLHDQLSKLHSRGARLLDQAAPAAATEELSLRELQGMAKWSMETEEALEKGILRLEDLLFTQQAANVEATMKEVERLRERLKEMLERYKETQDPEVKEAIKREVARLRQRMQELTERMRSQIKALPAEHINREAIEQAQMESSANKIAEEFDSIEQLLDQDDIDGALEALERMGENLEQMSQDVGEQFDRAQPETLSEFDKKMGELIDDANDLSQLQQDLERDSQELERELQEERKERVEEQLDELRQQMKRQIAEQRQAFEQLDRGSKSSLPQAVEEARQEAREALDQIERSLDQRDVEQALEQAQRSLDQLEEMRFQMSVTERFLKRDDPRRSAMQEGRRAAGPMHQRGEKIVEQLEEMMKQAQAQEQKRDPRAQQLAERQQRVSERAQQVEQKIKEAAKEYPSLEQQLSEPMRRGKEAMKEAEQGLRQQRMQRALDSERQALEQLRQLKESIQNSVEKQRNRSQREDKGEGKGAHSEDKVEIPKDTSRRAPLYKEQLEDGMKEGRLEEYESEIDKYYKSLRE